MKTIRYFDDLLPDKESAEQLVQWRLRVKALFDNLLDFGDHLFGRCLELAQKDGRVFHNTLLGLGRHILAYMDCLKVLLEQGCTEGCTPLMRSMLEATLGITHIVEEKSEERALAYQLARIKRRIKKLRMADKASKEGQSVAAELADDFLTPGLLDKMPATLGADADKLERELASQRHFDPIVAEWDRIKNPPGKKSKKDPEWYTLFSGEEQIRTWAKKMKSVSLYLFLYKDLSNESHAGDTTRTLFVGDSEIRPLRYPDRYDQYFRMAFMWFNMSYERLATFYDSELGEQFRIFIVTIVEPEVRKLHDVLTKMFGHMR